MIYLDYVATTPLNSEVLTTYHNLLENYFYNADSAYDKGIEINRLMEHSWGQKVIRFYDPDGNLIEVGTPMK